MLETIIDQQEMQIAELKKENKQLKRRIRELTGEKRFRHSCWFSGCKETRSVKEFYSWEEGTVWLCEEHREVNEGKTGYTVKRKQGQS